MQLTDTETERKGYIGKDVLLPILVWAGMLIFFLSIKHIPYDFSEKDGVILRFAAKFLATILLPLLLIYLLYKEKSDFGIYFPPYKESLKLSWRAYALGGPACMTFPLIGFLGWGFYDWKGSITLSAVFLVVFYFMPKLTRKLPTRGSIGIPNKKIIPIVWLSMLTLVLIYGTYYSVPVVWKILYFLFIVGFGEELFFRGYIQSALNRYFGTPYVLGSVKFGWGLFFAALLFGLTHALVSVPPTWPHALWTFIFGLTLGFIREKDGSILAAVIFHALMDMPLAFISS